MPTDPIIHSANTDNAIGEWKHIVVLVWRRQVNIDDALRFRRVGQDAIRRSDFASSIHLVEPTCSIPNDQVRKVVGSLGDGPKTSGVGAVVAEGAGLRVSVVRGVATGITLLLRRTSQVKVFSNVPECAVWMTQESEKAGQTGFSSAELAAAVETIRAKIPVR